MKHRIAIAGTLALWLTMPLWAHPLPKACERPEAPDVDLFSEIPDYETCTKIANGALENQRRLGWIISMGGWPAASCKAEYEWVQQYTLMWNTCWKLRLNGMPHAYKIEMLGEIRELKAKLRCP